MAEIFDGLESFSLEDSNGNNVYFGDLGLYIGGTQTGLRSEDFLPNSEDYVQSVIGNDKTYYFGSALRERNIQIPCFSAKVNEIERRNIQNNLFTKTPKKLILDRRKYRYLWVKLSPKEVNWDFIWDGDYYNTFETIDFIAYNPLYYSYYTAMDYELDSSKVYSENSIFYNNDILLSDIPSTIHNNISTSPYNFELYNHGNYESKIIIGLEGTGTNITVINNTNGESFTISSLSSENILINGEMGQISDSQISNGIISTPTILKTSKFSGDFINLNSGINNFTITGNGLSLNAKFLYRYTYI